jgi:splicing factor U2AF subunit
MMDGREFDGHKVKATYVTENEYYRAQGGEWIVG